MRWLVAFALVMVGCVASMPADDGTTADLACEAARMIVQARSSTPPAPKPDSEACERCDGEGFIGDRANIRIKCPDCDGTGKKPVSVLVRP